MGRPSRHQGSLLVGVSKPRKQKGHQLLIMKYCANASEHSRMSPYFRGDEIVCLR